jgi:hypothetical protein
LQTIPVLVPRHSEAGSIRAAFRHAMPRGSNQGRNDKAPPFGGALRNSTIQASALFVVLTAAGLLAGVLGLLAGLLAAALLRLAGPVLAALVLVALVLAAALLARIVLVVLVHHVLSC